MSVEYTVSKLKFHSRLYFCYLLKLHQLAEKTFFRHDLEMLQVSSTIMFMPPGKTNVLHANAD